MKKTLKVSVMALIAMFAFSTVADAQFGGLKKLANKAKAAVGADEGTKNEKEIDELIAKSKAFTPQKGKTPNATFTFDGTEVATWNGSSNELTIKADLGGVKAGTVLKIDNSGKVTDGSGNAKGSMNGTDIESPTLGKLQLKAKDGNYSLAISPKPMDVSKLSSYTVAMKSTNQDVFNTKYKLPISTGQKEGKGYTMFVNSDKDVKYTFAGHKCTVSDKEVGASLPIYVASLMLTQEQYNKEMIIDMLGYDPEKTYTTADLNNMIRWKDAATEAEIKKIEEGKTYSDDRVKDAKIAAIGLKGEWDRQGWHTNLGKWNDVLYYTDKIFYWVVYELPNGKNKVGFYGIVKNQSNNGLTERMKCTGFHEVTDWQRK